MLMGVLYARVYLIYEWYACGRYMHGVGFCIAYSNYRVFLGPQTTDKQNKRSAFFFILIRL